MDGHTFAWSNDGKGFKFEMPKMDGNKMTWKGDDGKVHTFTMPKTDGKNFVWVDEKGKTHKFDGKDGSPFIWSGDGKEFKFEAPKMDGNNMTWKDENGKVHKFEMPKMDGKNFIWTDEKGKKHTLDMNKEGHGFVWSGDDLKRMKFDGGIFKSADVSKLLDSLTPAQQAQAKKQGYLTPADLSASQKAMLGGLSKDGYFTITISKDGKKLTIKNK
jgi:hypothetical protein